MQEDGPVSGAVPCVVQSLESFACFTGRVAGLWLERADLLSLRALGALAGGELDPLVLLQTTEAVNLNRGVVHEDVGAAVVWGDEPIALVGVEPLHGALRHVPSPTG